MKQKKKPAILSQLLNHLSHESRGCSVTNSDDSEYWALKTAVEAGMKACAVDVRLTDPYSDISEILDAYGIKSLSNVCGQCLDNKKIVPNIPPMKQMYKFCHGKMDQGATEI